MLDKDAVVTALVEEWAAIDRLVSDLDEERWATPTACPGWTVQDVVSHIIGVEMTLSGQKPPLVEADVRGFPHVRNDIGAMNEHWVEAFRAEPPAKVLEQYRTITAARAEALRKMTDAEFQAPSWTPMGEATYLRFMRIRLFDCWLHDQDIRDAVGRPGNEDGQAAEMSLDEMTQALGYVVGKRAKVPDGSSVTFDLTGPVRRQIHVVVEGRARVVDSLPGPAKTTLSMTSSLFVRLCGGRTDTEARAVRFTGDTALGQQVASSLHFVI